MGLGIMLGAAATSAKDTYERLEAEKRRQAEFKEQERQREQRKALEEQSAALPAAGATVDANNMPETQRKALGLQLSPQTQDGNMVQPAATPAPTPLWQQNAAGGKTGLGNVLADSKASGQLPTRAPQMREVSQSDQMMMLSDIYRRNGQPEKAIEMYNRAKHELSNELGAAAAMAGVQGWDSLKNFTSHMKDGKDLSFSQIKGGDNDGKYMVKYGDGPEQMVNDSIHAGLMLSAAIRKDPDAIAKLVHQYGTMDLDRAKLAAQKGHWAAEEEVAKAHVQIQSRMQQLNKELQAAQIRHLDAQSGMLGKQIEELTRKSAAITGYADLAGKDPLLWGNEMLSAASTAETADPERLVTSNTVIDQSTGQPVSVTVGKLQGVVRMRAEQAQKAFQENEFVKAGKIQVNPQLKQYGVLDKSGVRMAFSTFDEAQKAAEKVWGAGAAATSPAAGGLPQQEGADQKYTRRKVRGAWVYERSPNARTGGRTRAEWAEADSQDQQ